MAKISLNEKADYILLSVKHTHKKDYFITMWRENNHGYTYFVKSAGRYAFLKDGYHDTETNIPVLASIVEALATHVDSKTYKQLVNSSAIWILLGVDLNRTPFKKQ